MGELQERTLSCCNAPQEKGEPRHGRLAGQVPAAGSWHWAGVSSCHAPAARAAAVPAVPESQHGSVTKPNKSTFSLNSTTRKSPLPPSGNNMDSKTSVSSSNDKNVYLSKQQQEKKNQKELLPQAWVPSAKTWILLNASPAGAETDSHWIFFTHTLKPLIGTLACQKMAGQLTTAQLLWLSWFTPQVTMQMRNAGFLSFTPTTQLLTSPK